MKTGDIRDLLAIDAPVVLGPFGGMSSVELTSQVSELGGLGSFGLYGYGADRIHHTATELRARTNRPFALNLWIPTGEEVRPDDVELGHYTDAMAPLFAEVDAPVPHAPRAFLPDFGEQFDAVLAQRPEVISFVYGVPSAEVVDAAHTADIRLLGTATTVAEARALQAAGIDAIVATGLEAGGHRVSFLRPAEQSLIGGLALIPQIVDAVTVPVVAAGGIADRRGVAAAFALGASAVQVGTAFLRTHQSAANDAYRHAITATAAESTVLTRAMSGRLARGIPNRAMRVLETSGRIAPFPAQNWLTGQFRAAAARQDIAELQSLWAGQAAPLATKSEAAEVFTELMAGVPDDPARGARR